MSSPASHSAVARENDPFSPLSVRRVGRFMVRVMVYLLLAPLAIVLGTLVHEGAHALMIIASPASLTALEILPFGWFGAVLGMTHFEGELGAAWAFHVSMAPVYASTVLVAITYAMRGRLPRGRWGEMALILGVIGPVVDVSMGLSGLLLGLEGSDLYLALYGFEPLVATVAVAWFVGAGIAGWRTFVQVSPSALSQTEFGLGFLLFLVLPWLGW